MPDLPDPPSAKAALRTALLRARRTLAPQRLSGDSARVQSALRGLLSDLLPAGGGATVAAYVPVGIEPGGPDLPEVLRGALSPDGRLLLPVLRDDLDLDWAAYEGVLVPAGRGLREPPGPRLGRGAVAGAALWVVPAVAVDRRGVRLGRGGGSFDRALTRANPHARVVALLHDGELCDDDLPAEPHDRPVHGVVTPSGGFVPIS